MSNSKSLSFETLNKDDLSLLITGLVSLEGALSALDGTAPESIDRLKLLLSQRVEKLKEPKRKMMTTKQVAETLECHERYVSMLCEKGKIKLAKPGKRGRGNSTLYYRKSVEVYRANRQQND